MLLLGIKDNWVAKLEHYTAQGSHPYHINTHRIFFNCIHITYSLDPNSIWHLMLLMLLKVFMHDVGL